MPNWANTEYRITGERKQIDKLEKVLRELESNKEPIVPNGFGNLWLGCVVNALGGDWNAVYCRGEIYEIDREGDVLTVNQQTAWGEMDEFRHFLEEALPGIKIYYYVEESGMDVYETNDKDGLFFPDRYYVVGGDDCCEYYNDLKGVSEHISGIVGYQVSPSIKAIEKAIDKYNEEIGEDNDCCLYLNKIEVTD